MTVLALGRTEYGTVVLVAILVAFVAALAIELALDAFGGGLRRSRTRYPARARRVSRRERRR